MVYPSSPILLDNFITVLMRFNKKKFSGHRPTYIYNNIPCFDRHLKYIINHAQTYNYEFALQYGLLLFV